MAHHQTLAHSWHDRSSPDCEDVVWSFLRPSQSIKPLKNMTVDERGARRNRQCAMFYLRDAHCGRGTNCHHVVDFSLSGMWVLPATHSSLQLALLYMQFRRFARDKHCMACSTQYQMAGLATQGCRTPAVPSSWGQRHDTSQQFICYHTQAHTLTQSTSRLLLSFATVHDWYTEQRGLPVPQQVQRAR